MFCQNNHLLLCCLYQAFNYWSNPSLFDIKSATFWSELFNLPYLPRESVVISVKWITERSLTETRDPIWQSVFKSFDSFIKFPKMRL